VLRVEDQLRGREEIPVGLERPGLAFAEILVLCLSIVATGLAFQAKSRTAALLLVPYLAWTSFAVILNLNLWRLNS